ncbi:hypothetical protein [Streptomyces sp. NPDC001480]|uniref:hypothetical protein n=1 Tax=Streptomyces sp. NPDC001480 TaxID=3364577 RepID=UPI0036ACBE30
MSTNDTERRISALLAVVAVIALSIAGAAVQVAICIAAKDSWSDTVHSAAVAMGSILAFFVATVGLYEFFRRR